MNNQYYWFSFETPDQCNRFLYSSICHDCIIWYGINLFEIFNLIFWCYICVHFEFHHHVCHIFFYKFSQTTPITRFFITLLNTVSIASCLYSPLFIYPCSSLLHVLMFLLSSASSILPFLSFLSSLQLICFIWDTRRVNFVQTSKMLSRELKLSVRNFSYLPFLLFFYILLFIQSKTDLHYRCLKPYFKVEKGWSSLIILIFPPIYHNIFKISFIFHHWNIILFSHTTIALSADNEQSAAC